MKIDGLSPLPFRLNDLKRVKNDIEFQRIISGKYNMKYEFRPVGKKTSGSAIGNMYEKLHTKPNIPKEGSNEFPLKRWLGKINSMFNETGLFSTAKVGNSYLNEVIKTENDLNSAAIFEYLGNCLYRLLSDSTFETPKMRLARLPIMNEFLKDHALANIYVNELNVKSCYRVMCKWSEDYKDLEDLRVNYNFMIIPFMRVIRDYGVVPERVIDPENSEVEVDIEGIMGVLACSTSLGDIDCLGVTGKNCGYIIERNDKSGEVDRIRIVKIDPGMCFYFNMIRNHRLKNQKDILFCSNYDNRGISWDKLSEKQKIEFLEVKLHHLEILRDMRILKYLFFQRDYFGKNGNYKTSESKLFDLLRDFLKHLEQEMNLVRDDRDEYIYDMKRIKYLKGCASFYKNNGDFDRSLLYCQKLLSLSSLLEREEHHEILNWCGNIERERGNYDKAMYYIEEGLRIEGTSQSNVATSYHNSGRIYDCKGEYDKSIECYEKSLKIRNKSLPLNHPDIAESFQYLGVVYSQKGEYDKAIDFLEKSLKIRVKTLSSNHPDIARSYNNIGIIYMYKGEYDKSIEYYEKSLKIYEKTLPSNHPLFAVGYNNLGGAYSDKGEYDKSIEYYEKSLKIYEKTLPSNHPHIATSYYNLGIVYRNKGKYDKSIENFEKSLKVKEKTLPSNHPSIASSYNTLGVVYSDKGEYDKAIEYIEKGLKIREKTLPSNHPDIATSYYNLGNVYRENGKYNKSIECHEEGLRIQEKSLPSNHPSIGDSYNNLGLVYEIKGKYDKAKEYYEKSLRIYLKSSLNSSNNPGVSRTQRNIKRLKKKMKRKS